MVWYIERCQKHTLLKKNYQKKRKKSKHQSRNWSNIKTDSLNLLLDLVIVNLVFFIL